MAETQKPQPQPEIGSQRAFNIFAANDGEKAGRHRSPERRRGGATERMRKIGKGTLDRVRNLKDRALGRSDAAGSVTSDQSTPDHVAAAPRHAVQETAPANAWFATRVDREAGNVASTTNGEAFDPIVNHAEELEAPAAAADVAPTEAAVGDIDLPAPAPGQPEIGSQEAFQNFADNHPNAVIDAPVQEPEAADLQRDQATADLFEGNNQKNDSRVRATHNEQNPYTREAVDAAVGRHAAVDSEYSVHADVVGKEDTDLPILNQSLDTFTIPREVEDDSDLPIFQEAKRAAEAHAAEAADAAEEPAPAKQVSGMRYHRTFADRATTPVIRRR